MRGWCCPWMIQGFPMRLNFSRMNLCLTIGHWSPLKLGGGNSNIFWMFTPNPGEMMQFDEHIFQLGWFNHQLAAPFMEFLQKVSFLRFRVVRFWPKTMCKVGPGCSYKWGYKLSLQWNPFIYTAIYRGYNIYNSLHLFSDRFETPTLVTLPPSPTTFSRRAREAKTGFPAISQTRLLGTRKPVSGTGWREGEATWWMWTYRIPVTRNGNDP